MITLMPDAASRFISVNCLTAMAIVEWRSDGGSKLPRAGIMSSLEVYVQNFAQIYWVIDVSLAGTRTGPPAIVRSYAKSLFLPLLSHGMLLMQVVSLAILGKLG